MAFELVNATNQPAIIKVIGVGGGGGNAVMHMLGSNIEGVEFICANTDAQALQTSGVQPVLQLGCGITQGLGAGSDPEVGRQAALEDRDSIMGVLDGADMLFIAAGMGGGTGTGAAPVVAQVAKEMGILTVAVVTRPFDFEGEKRANVADEGITELKQFVDSLITIPNEKLKEVLGGEITMTDAFGTANDVLSGSVQGIAELITRPGLINVDFADVRTVMRETGMAMVGSAKAEGEDRARTAAEKAIASPLLDDVDLKGARGILVNITAGQNMTIAEFEEVGSIVKGFAAEDAVTIVGTCTDPDMPDSIRVTIVATGLGKAAPPEPAPAPTPPSNDDIVSLTPPKWEDLEEPTIMRKKEGDINIAETEGSSRVSDEHNTQIQTDILDIPAFLRRQAD
jgi:cell division protein FtsZ